MLEKIKPNNKGLAERMERMETQEKRFASGLMVAIPLYLIIYAVLA